MIPEAWTLDLWHEFSQVSRCGDNSCDSGVGKSHPSGNLSFFSVDLQLHVPGNA